MRAAVYPDFSKPIVSYASLRHYMKLSSRFSFKEAQEKTGLSRTTLLYYLEGDWPNGRLIKKGKIGERVFYGKLNNSQDPNAIAKELLANGGVSLVYKTPIKF